MSSSQMQKLWAVVLLVQAVSLAGAQEVLVQGRVGGEPAQQTGTASLPLLLSWAATTVHVRFQNSDRVQVEFARPPSSTRVSNNSFRFVLDGVNSQQFITGDGAWLREGLTIDPHDLVITKLTEPMYGVSMLQSVNLSTAGSFLPATLPASVSGDRKLLLLGDSLTAGYGNLGDSSCKDIQLNGEDTLEPSTEDGTLSYGGLVAAHYTADYEVLAWSGAKQFPNPSGEQRNSSAPSVPQLLDQLIAGQRSGPTPNFTSWIPQVAILAGGSNDFINLPFGVTMEDWTSQWMDFIQRVQELYMQPIILVLSFSEEQQQAGTLEHDQIVEYLSYMAHLGEQIIERGMSNTHFLQLDGRELPLDNWCGLHPNELAHEFISRQVIQYLDTIVPAWTVAPQAPATPDVSTAG